MPQSSLELFPPDSTVNLLPQDGILNYFGPIMSYEEGTNYFDVLMNTIQWKNDESVIFGKHIITKRKVAWYGDLSFDYTYSNTTKQAHPWTSELLELRKLIEEVSGFTFNSCLLNLYHSGEEGVGWHSDNERSLGKETIIASLSFGAKRLFAFKHKTKEIKTSILLEHGSLLIMRGSIQANWLHSLPKTKKIAEPRINLTFRTIVEGDK